MGENFENTMGIEDEKKLFCPLRMKEVVMEATFETSRPSVKKISRNFLS